MMDDKNRIENGPLERDDQERLEREKFLKSLDEAPGCGRGLPDCDGSVETCTCG